MNLGTLDPNNYLFVGGYTVQNNKDLIVPDSLELSQTMLVKWQIRQLVKGATIDQIDSATLSAVLEIPGLGKLEDDSYSIKPSIQGDDRVQLISFNPALPYKLTLSQPSELVLNSRLEFYQFTSLMSNTNNPAIVDTSAIVGAINAGTMMQVSAIQAASQAENLTVRRSVESSYTPVLWSNANNHKAVLPDTTDRMGVKLFNNGTVPVAYDTYIDITQKTVTTQQDNIIQPGGETVITVEEAKMGILLYTLTAIPPGKTASILITQQYPTLLATAP
jgi:hypothetical protein